MFFYGVGVGEKEWFASHYAVQLLTLPFYLTNVERNKKSPIQRSYPDTSSEVKVNNVLCLWTEGGFGSLPSLQGCYSAAEPLLKSSAPHSPLYLVQSW